MGDEFNVNTGSRLIIEDDLDEVQLRFAIEESKSLAIKSILPKKEPL